ncbi:aminotransferase class-V [Xylariaceae sp. FL0255]|nr:aminotransferase class-V [Xylariaceae sp. FL0255]
MSDYDIAAVRSKFPALGGDQVYLDNAGGSQVLGTVIDDIRDYLAKTNVQLGATYKTGKLSTERYNDGFTAGARYVNSKESEIVFGSSTTQLFRNASYTFSFAEGDEVVLSSIDHETNIAPWVDLAERQKLTIKWWTPSLPASSSSSSKHINPELNPSNLAPLLSSRTRLISLTHASNVLGSITPVAEIVAAVRAGPSPDALVAVDGVSYAPHRPLDLHALGVDLYAFSWYKVYGPHISMLYASPRAFAAMRSLGHYFKKGVNLEEKIGLAGASYELLSGIPSTVSYLSPAPSSTTSPWPGMIAHEHLLQSTLLKYLKSRSDVTIYGDPTGSSDARVATVSFLIAGWKSQDVVETVEKETNFGFRWGCFYSERLCKDLLGLNDDGTIRVSMVHYNTVDEVKGFIDALEKLIPRKA